jgi:hypothetical protein
MRYGHTPYTGDSLDNDYGLHRTKWQHCRFPVATSRSEVRKRKSQREQSYPVLSRGGLQGFEMLRIPQFVDNRLTDGG